MTEEGRIKKEILEYLDTIPRLKYFKVATTGVWDPSSRKFRRSAGTPGCPDILVCFRGRFVGIEVKSQKGRLSEAQEIAKEEIERASGYSFVCRSVSDVATALLEVASKL